MRDFTIDIYKKLITALKDNEYRFYVLEDLCITEIHTPYVVLRHDVDRKPYHALRIAELEKLQGINATYYFRIKKKVFDADVIKKISSLGHEIGYHFEDLSDMHGDIDKALISFKSNIEKLRSIVPVNTVSMHGKPLSKYDNRKLVSLLDFEELGLLCEPYTIVDKLGMVYLSDTGRRWDNRAVNFRDKADNRVNLNIKNTEELINSLGKEFAGRNLMINVHPERWEEKLLPGMKNAVWQSLKNGVKYVLIKTGYGR